jgi:glycosyltransferase involved in cell wall biosynthesis
MENISVIIPCRNEEKYIERCLTSFIEMDYPKDSLEILLVDGRSEDRTLEIVKNFQLRYPIIKIIDNPNLFAPHAFNIGIKNATSEYIMIASAHSSFEKNYISEVLKALKTLNCDGAGGVLKTDVKNKTRKTLSICKVLSHQFGVGNSKFRVGTSKPISVDIVPFGIYKKSIFETVGYYNERLKRNQDMELSKRMIEKGNKIFLIPTAKSIYFARETYKDLALNNFGNGFWIMPTVYITRKISSLSLRHFIPMIFLLSIILPLIFMPVLPMIGLISFLSFTSYAILLSIISFKINDKTTRFINIFLAFLVLHLSYGVGSLTGITRLDYLQKQIIDEQNQI